MIKRIETRNFIRNNKAITRTRIVYVCSCDHCHQEIELPKSLVNEFQFCNVSCQRQSQLRGGVLDLKKRKISLERFGTENPFQSEIIKEKINQTIVTTYGSIENFNLNLKKKREETFLKKYGVTNPQKIPEIVQKTKNTKIARGIKQFQSNIEINVECLLKEIYNNVYTQKWVNGRPIDFYIKDIDLYIQVDGEFFHGLTERSLQYDFVRSNFDRDREQDKWFLTNNLLLLRIPEKTCNQLNKDKLIELINDFLILWSR